MMRRLLCLSGLLLLLGASHRAAGKGSDLPYHYPTGEVRLTMPDGWLVTGVDTEGWACIARTDPQGRELWRMRPGERTQDSILKTVLVPEGGSVSLMTNHFVSSAGQNIYRYNLAYVDDDGNLLRTEALKGPLPGIPNTLFAADSGFLVFYTGGIRRLEGADTFFETRVLECRDGLGNLRWKHAFDEIEVNLYEVRSLPDGGFLCLATSEDRETGEQLSLELLLDGEGNLSAITWENEA